MFEFFGSRNAFARLRSLALIFGAAVILTGAFATSSANAGTYAMAKRYIGWHEAKHTGKLARAIGVNPRKTPWCGAFAATVAKRAGKKVPGGHLKAASWKRAGKAVSLKSARKGDVVVVRTRRGHHVGFYAGKSGGKVQLIGGNQSNMVRISNYRIGNVVSVRRL